MYHLNQLDYMHYYEIFNQKIQKCWTLVLMLKENLEHVMPALVLRKVVIKGNLHIVK